jgi:branched-chain amino acid transport system ATP-binding protein
MNVRDNLLMGAYGRGDVAKIDDDMQKVFEKFPRLRERQSQMAGTMSGGEQQMLAIARAIMSDPSIILLDEPTLGLAPMVCRQIAQTIRDLHEEGRTVVLVEQNARLALGVAHRGYVIERGRVVLKGTGRELLNDPMVQKAYLGVA